MFYYSLQGISNQPNYSQSVKELYAKDLLFVSLRPVHFDLTFIQVTDMYSFHFPHPEFCRERFPRLHLKRVVKAARVWRVVSQASMDSLLLVRIAAHLMVPSA